MDDNRDYIELVRKAQSGDKESLDRLAETVKVCLVEYVQRLTLDDNLTEDIVQECILEMYKVFDKLKSVDEFWRWLCGIAFNKVRQHYGRRWRRKTVYFGGTGDKIVAGGGPDALAEMITAEWKQIVLISMRELEPRHRAVIAMRCYDQLSYGEIAKVMECSELGVRSLFYRAKKTLAKKLSEHGLGKGALLGGSGGIGDSWNDEGWGYGFGGCSGDQ